MRKRPSSREVARPLSACPTDLDFRKIFDGIDQGMCVMEMLFDENDVPVDYRFLHVNAAFEEQTGLIAAEGKKARELVPDLDDFWFETYGRVALTGVAERFENHAPAMGRWFEVYAFRPGSPDDRQVALLFNDVTKLKEQEEALRRSEARFRNMADTAPAMLWITNDKNETTFLSKGWYENTVQEPGEGLGMGWIDAVHPDDRAHATRTFLAAANEHLPFSFDYRLKVGEDEFRWAIDNGRPRFDGDGRFLGYIGSVVDVHDRKLQEEALIAADRNKDRFMAVLSHELRNPLAPIRNSLEVLAHAEIHEEQSRQALEILDRQVDQLARLIDDLLETTRVSQDKIRLQRQPLELNTLLRDTIADHQSVFANRQLELAFVPAAHAIAVQGDPNRLSQVIGNLLQNAAKFTAPGGRTQVTVQVEPATDRAIICVEDTGQGISSELLSTLFEPFTQGTTPVEHVTGGLGLGLALVKSLVELHGGTVRASSDGPGKGSTFEICLPLAEATTARASSPRRSGSPGRCTILLIEDNHDVARSMAMILELKGHQVSVAHSAYEGIELASNIRPDVILCDIGLPEMDGYTVAEILRHDPRHTSTFLVALSGYAMPSDIKKATQAGFDRHLAKPPNLEFLDRYLTEAKAGDNLPG